MKQEEPVIPKGDVIIESVDFKDGTFLRTNIKIPLQKGAIGLGRPVTLEAADAMINKYAESMTDASENISIEFGKETILYLLSQQGCESVRFYFCHNQDDKKSIVAMPIDALGKLIRISGNETVTGTGEQAKPAGEQQTKSVAGTEVGGGQSLTAWREMQQRNGSRSFLV